MKRETLLILQKVKDNKMSIYEAAEELFILFRMDGCLNPYMLFDNPIGHWCASCKFKNNCSVLKELK